MLTVSDIQLKGIIKNFFFKIEMYLTNPGS